MMQHFKHSNVIARSIAAAIAPLIAASALPLQAQPITVPNYSFESPVTAYVDINVASWQKNPQPDFYSAFSGYGIDWLQTAGAFTGVPYINHDGNQAGYILAVPQVALFQDYSTSPTHDFSATYDVGKAYSLTVGVYGSARLFEGSTLDLSLYYLDGSGNHVTVRSTAVTYTAAAFPTTAPLSLVDFSVYVPTVQAGDAWAGQHIGIELESAIPLGLTSFGNWDFDNVRLSAVPEPGSATLLTLGFGALVACRFPRRRPR
jgi:hypothetical protein